MMPRWWYANSSLKEQLTKRLLIPASWLYQLLVWLRSKTAMPHRPALPTLCIGNVTAGGAGKTPTTLMLAHTLTTLGHTPHVASRGYGSEAASASATIAVDVMRDNAAQVGDEPLMMAQHFPVWVGKSRATSIAAAHTEGASVVLMDDGLQNPTIHKTVSLLVIDGEFGIGNGRIIPAGPLREPLADAVKKCTGALIIGNDIHRMAERISHINPALALFHVSARTKLPSNIQKTPLLAFAGLARPEKFFDGLRAAGATLLTTRSFSDHHPYSEAELMALSEEAQAIGATLITTEKDATKIPANWRSQIATASLTLEMEDSQATALKELLIHYFPIT